MGSRILNGVEATGPGPAIKSGAATHTVMVWFSNSGGSVAVLKFTIEGRIRGDGIPDVWTILIAEHTFDGAELAAKVAYQTVASKPVDDIRANITTLTETGTT